MSFRYENGKAGDNAASITLQPLGSLTSWGQDSAGELYMVFGDDGSVAKLVRAP